MKAVLCTSLGPPDGLTVADVAPPVPAEDEVVVKVKAIGLNFFDTLIIQGKYQVKPELPFSPGGEISGEVENDACGFRAGERVMAYIGYGGAREKLAVLASKLVRMPPELSFEAAAGLSIAYGTSLYALKDRGCIQSGETLAVLGASGGVGQAAVEIGKAMGAHVIACASSDEKLAFCKALGADELLNYQTRDLKDALKTMTSARGVDVIYDAVGGPLAEPALRALAWNGRYLVVGFASGEVPKFPLNLLLVKGLSAVGVYWGAHTEKEPELHRSNMAMLLKWAADGHIKPHIDRTYPLARLADGLHAIAQREVVGKVVVTP